MRFRFIHAADLHLDTPFEGLAQVSPEIADLLRDASLDAFDALVRLALEREAAFVLIAGDIYDGEERGVRAQLRFLRGVRQLANAGVRTFVVHGNHDPLGAWSAVRAWPDELTVFGPDDVGEVPVETGGVRVATVYGLSYGRRDVTDNLVLRFPRGPRGRRGAAAEGLRIGLLHCSVGDQPDHSPYSPCSLSDLCGCAIDYWALGHVHKAGVLHREPWVVYPGNTQGRSPKPSEMGAKGALVVEVDGAVVRSVEEVPLDAVRFVDLTVALGGASDPVDLGALSEELMRRAVAIREENAGRALLVRATLTGRTALHGDLAARGALPDLLRELRDAVADAEPVFWWESLRDRSRPIIDLDVVRARDDFSANVLALADSILADSAKRVELVRTLTPSTPADLSRRCGPCLDDDLPELLEEAALLALEALEKGALSCE